MANAPNSIPTGFYIDGNIGYGKVNQKVSNAPKHDTSGIAWNINGGYKFTQNWAADFGYTRYAAEDFGNVPSYGPTKAKKPYSVHLAAKGIYRWKTILVFWQIRSCLRWWLFAK